MSRELIVRPLGLVTRPNQYGQYPIGGLSSAINCVMRAPGILEAAPATVLGLAFGSTNHVVHNLQPLPAGVMMTWSVTGSTWTVRRDSTSLTYDTTFATTPAYSANGRLQSIRMRDRTFFNSTTHGILVNEESSPTVIRRAGLPASQMPRFTFTNTNAVTLNDKDVVGYCVVMHRKYADGYELMSKPSPISVLWNHSGSAARPQVFIQAYAYVHAVLEGDVLELCRTNILQGVAVGAAFPDPGTTLQKIAMHTVLSSELPSVNYSVYDDTRRSELGETSGEALYTNPGQQGAFAANRIPPIAQCLAAFKNYAFYGCITERPQLQFSIPGFISATFYTGWNTAAFRENGIGKREIAGTISAGSAVVTGVSATNMLGVDVGQRSASGGPFPGSNTSVVSFNAGAGTITMSAVASAPAATFTLCDVYEFNGTQGLIGELPWDIVNQIGGGVSLEFTTTETVQSEATDPSTGVRQLTYFIEPGVNDTGVAFTWRMSNGQNYEPPIPKLNETALTIAYKPRKNAIMWSKDNQPEHVPATNIADIGNGEIIAMESTRDALWIFCTDGLFRLSGDGGQWRVDIVDTTCVLAAPRASCVLREVVYAYTNAGFVRITDSGVEPLSQRIVGDLLPGAEYTETASIIVEKNEIEDEVIVRLSSSQVYVYSVRENAYTTLAELDVTCMAYARYPVSGSPAIAFGRSPSGSTPRYELWNSTSSWLAATTRFQPVFAGDPFTTKQWIDAAFVFACPVQGAGPTGNPFFPAWNGTETAAINMQGDGRYVNELRGIAGVPRRAAIGNTLCPGYRHAAFSSAVRFLALSLRYRQFGEQQLKR